MGEVSYQLPRETVGDVACVLLRQRGAPLPIKDLIEAIAARGVVRAQTPGRTAAIIHTEINLDSRLQHLGGGLWGLRQWAPRRRSERTSPRPRPEWAEDDLDSPLDDDPAEERDPAGHAREGWSDDNDRWDE